MKRTTCSACGHTDLDEFLDLGMSPIADAYTATPDEASPTYPLQVAVCAKCRLVQLLEVVDHTILFGTGYSFYSSASPPLSAYHARYAADVLTRHGDLAARGVVEVGCNDGDMLRHFTAAGHRALGVDPAAGPVEVARSRDLDVRIRPFSLAFAKDLRDSLGPRGLIVANHVLAHVEDVFDVLAGVANLLADDGVAMVEVQYLPDLLVNNAFDLVYHEHRNFFSLTSLEQAALRHGLNIVDAELTDRQGGSLRVTIAKQPRPNDTVDRLRTSEAWLDSFCAYEAMQGRAERIRDRLRDLVSAQPGITAVYGAPAKATTLLNFCELTAADLSWCVDSTPAKQGRHIPGTGIPIVAPDFMGAATYVLAAWNYTSDIMQRNPHKQWIVPLPAPVLL
jgi:novobiocin biosynthesis protein NovU/D-mycarose 3-C-methyltransferase